MVVSFTVPFTFETVIENEYELVLGLGLLSVSLTLMLNVLGLTARDRGLKVKVWA